MKIPVALSMLLGGNRYYATDHGHVFDTLSVRLCLDLDISSPVTYPLSQKAVHLHMRVAKAINPSTGYLFTRIPAEPLLALAAMEHPCLSERSWEESLLTFTSELLKSGAINKGSKGELLVRLIFTLARDSATSIQLPIKIANTKGAAPLLTVKSFLQALFPQEYHSEINSIDSAILDAHLNFVIFTSTTQHLSSDSFHSLCYALLRRSTALHCATQQELYDLFIPFYWGTPNRPYNLLEIAAIVVQVKNRGKKAPASNLKQYLLQGFLEGKG